MISKPKVLILANGCWGGKDFALNEGFDALLEKGKASQIEYMYYHFVAKEHGVEEAKRRILELASSFLPDIIVWQHVMKFPVTQDFIQRLNDLPSKPTLVYDDGDPYGRIHCRVTKSMRLLLAKADLISLRGIGRFSRMIAGKRDTRVILTQHVTDLTRFDSKWTPTRKRKYDVIFIGLRMNPRLGFIRNRFRWGRAPGVYEREQLVRKLGHYFGDRFAVYGKNWDGFIGNKGPIPFDQQVNVIRESWVSIGYDHHPSIPFYFSDRLSIALLSGVAHVSHYHDGYEHMFRNMEDLAWFHSIDEAVDVVRFMLSRGPDWLIELGQRGRGYSFRWLTGERVWESFFDQVVQFRARGQDGKRNE